MRSIPWHAWRFGYSIAEGCPQGNTGHVRVPAPSRSAGHRAAFIRTQGPGMKFSIDPGSLSKTLRVLARKHPSHARRDLQVQIKANADGIEVETNGSSAFLPAQVSVAGACCAPRLALTRVIATYPSGKPITIEAIEGRLHVGKLRLPISVHFRSRENDAY